VHRVLAHVLHRTRRLIRSTAPSEDRRFVPTIEALKKRIHVCVNCYRRRCSTTHSALCSSVYMYTAHVSGEKRQLESIVYLPLEGDTEGLRSVRTALVSC
jgi:hypothetical protein